MIAQSFGLAAIREGEQRENLCHSSLPALCRLLPRFPAQDVPESRRLPPKGGGSLRTPLPDPSSWGGTLP
jgi:hypothetical protein